MSRYRLFALLGTLATLFLPFAYISETRGNLTNVVIWAGLLWYNSNLEIFGFQGNGSESFQTDWLASDGLYHNYFDPMFIVGIAVLILLLANIGISVISSEKKNKNAAAIILIICGIGLTIARLAALGQEDLSFYTQSDGLFGTFTYIEVPLALIYSLVFGILDLRQ